MKVLGNIIWFILGGFVGAVLTFLEACLLCITIIFIPIGLQLFKVARFLIWPMGKRVVERKNSEAKLVLNIIWCILGGIWNAIGYWIVGGLFCITIIGIPFGLQYFKLARFVLTPLGHDFEKIA